MCVKVCMHADMMRELTGHVLGLTYSVVVGTIVYGPEHTGTRLRDL